MKIVKLKQVNFFEIKSLDSFSNFFQVIRNAADTIAPGRISLNEAQSSSTGSLLNSTEAPKTSFEMSRDIDTVRDAWAEYIKYIIPMEEKGFLILNNHRRHNLEKKTFYH